MGNESLFRELKSYMVNKDNEYLEAKLTRVEIPMV